MYLRYRGGRFGTTESKHSGSTLNCVLSKSNDFAFFVDDNEPTTCRKHIFGIRNRGFIKHVLTILDSPCILNIYRFEGTFGADDPK